MYADDALEWLDEAADLFAGEVVVAGLASELQLGCLAFELHLLDPHVDDGRLRAGLEGRAVPSQLGVALADPPQNTR
ncbi:MAG: hypothetical protein ACKVWR_01860 [Acidimicrobiales bacterium]